MPRYKVTGYRNFNVTPEFQGVLREIIAKEKQDIEEEKQKERQENPAVYNENDFLSLEGMDFHALSKYGECHSFAVGFKMKVEAPQRGGQDGVYHQVIHRHIWKSGHIYDVEGWYSSDIVFTVNRDLERNRFGGPFTEEEQANTDVILTSVPANSTNQVINAARKRRHRLRRLLLARAFSQSNPNLSFRKYGRSHTNQLEVEGTDIRITFQSRANRVKVSSEFLPQGFELIEPTDSHRFQAILHFVEASLAQRKAAEEAERAAREANPAAFGEAGEIRNGEAQDSGIPF